MNVRRFHDVRGISLTAITSLIVGVAALSIVLFLLVNFSNNLNSALLSAGPSAISQDLLQMIVIWPGLCFLLAMMGSVAGFLGMPDSGVRDKRTPACKWICRAGIGLGVSAIFVDMLIISYLRALAPVLGQV